ncbi:ATP-dependent RNA helicase RhlE [compost metagenome]
MEVVTIATIEIGNIHSKLLDANISALVAVDTRLAVMTPNCNFSAAYKSGKWDGMTRFFSVATKKFPSGLLSQVAKALDKAGEAYTIKDTRTPLGYVLPDSITLHDPNGDITLRDYQYDSVKQGLEATRGVINVATNGGKTEIAAGIIKCILPKLPEGKKILFFTHSKEIFYQSHARLEKRLQIPVGLIGDGKWEEKPVTVVMIPTISQYLSVPKTLPKNAKRTKAEKEIASIGKSNPERVRELRDWITEFDKTEWEKIKANVKKTKTLFSSAVAFLADEVHHASSTTWYDVFMKLENCYYRFGLTGTVDQSDKINTNRLFGCTGRIISKISNQFLIDNGFSAKPTVNMIDTSIDEVFGDYRSAYEEGIIYNETRNNAFAAIISERAESGNQCLIIVNETSHGEEVLSILESLGIEAVFTHGDRSTKFRNESLEGFKNGDIRVLISTSILDEGVDVSGINCLFLMAGGKSMRQLLQRIGRGLRKKEDGSGVEVFDCLDLHSKYLAEHTLERYNTYKAEGFTVVKMEV